MPLAVLGGASGGDFGFPQQAFETPPWNLGIELVPVGLLTAGSPVFFGWRWMVKQKASTELDSNIPPNGNRKIIVKSTFGRGYVSSQEGSHL